MGAAGGHATHHEAWSVTIRTLDTAEAFSLLFIYLLLRGRVFLHITGHLGNCSDSPASYSRALEL